MKSSFVSLKFYRISQFCENAYTSKQNIDLLAVFPIPDSLVNGRANFDADLNNLN